MVLCLIVIEIGFVENLERFCVGERYFRYTRYFGERERENHSKCGFYVFGDSIGERITTVSAVFTYWVTVFGREILVGENATVILRFGERTYIGEVLTQLQVSDLG